MTASVGAYFSRFLVPKEKKTVDDRGEKRSISTHVRRTFFFLLLFNDLPGIFFLDFPRHMNDFDKPRLFLHCFTRRILTVTN